FKDAQFRNSLEAPLPFLYLPSWLGSGQTDARMVVRVAGDTRAMIPALRREIKAIDSNVPISEDVPLTQQIDAEHRPVLLSSAVLTWSGGLALFVTMIGLYGVLAFAVSRRTREIGVRMALGAQTTDVLRLVVGQGLRLVAIGALIGLLTAFASTRLIKSLLYGVGATDPLTFTAVVLLLIAVAVLACLIPARRATKVDPIVALRYE
ncbi:MAG TPA: FtsX-like permease family protein, partial [Pyrinomonadaceae bacterium]|nr:FtsX-like permease family protein [Pyrinomonadaceae bacterium]